MKPAITFIVPVRHQANASNWPALCRRLTQTVDSISAQSDINWRGVVVANEGADLPKMHKNFYIKRVNFHPNPVYDISSARAELVYDAVRLDKGRRILKGMLSMRETEYFMVVDDDDFVSANLTKYASDNLGANGWKVRHGWIWGDGGSLIMKHDNFDKLCGSSLIIRSDLYNLPMRFEDACSSYIKSMLGSHILIDDILADRGFPLSILPFRGAVYRVGHTGAHSKSRNMIRSEILNRTIFSKPLNVLGRIRSLRILNGELRHEFNIS